MGFIGKLFAFAMFPLSILIVLEELGIYSLELPVNKAVLGAILTIVLEIITLTMLHFHFGKPSVMNAVTAIIFVLIATASIGSVVLGIFQKEAAVILAVIMFVSALYALH